MSKVQKLRASVSQRLSAAAEEILELFERTVAEYEEQLRRSTEENKRQQKLLDAVFRPEVRILRADVQQLLKDEVPPEQQQQRSSSLHQEEPPRVKEEEEEVWRAEQLRWLEEADGTKFTPAPAESHVETPPSPQLLLNQPEESRDAAERLATPADGEPDVRLAPDGVYDTPRAEEPAAEGRSSGSTSTCVNVLRNNNIHVNDLRSSAAQRPFSCSECNKTFVRRTNLMNHIRYHTGEKPFSCSVCGMRFMHRSKLVTHERIHTAEKPFSCSVCGCSFSQRGSLSKHMRIHTGEKPYSCSYCGKRFSQRVSMTQHLSVHTGETPYSCRVCGKGFSRHSHAEHHSCVDFRDASVGVASAEFSQ